MIISSKDLFAEMYERWKEEQRQLKEEQAWRATVEDHDL